MRDDIHDPDLAAPNEGELSTDAEVSGLSRREVIRRALYACGFTVAASNVTLLTACSSTEPRSEEVTRTPFTTDDVAWLDEVAETILPETETPGAKAAEVGAFIALMVTDTYSPEEHQDFRAAMDDIEESCRKRFGAGIVDASPEQRHELLAELDRDQWQLQQDAGDEEDSHPFRGIKWLTLLGYFTSEIGYTQAMRYRETPGRYEPCVPYDGGPSWARHA